MKIKGQFAKRGVRASLTAATLAVLSAVTAAVAVEPGTHPRAGALNSQADGLNKLQALRDQGPRTVTLITGDQVLLSTAAGRSVSVLPRKGRESVNFITTHERVGSDDEEHAYVIPVDALPLISAGKLDRELFNVTALAAYRYDDAKSATLPLIIAYAGRAQQRGPAASVSVAGAAIRQRFSAVNGAAVSAPKLQLGSWWDAMRASGSAAKGIGAQAAGAALGLDSSIQKIWLDRILKPALDRSAPAIGAPALWARGYTGEGVVVAVIDTGVDTTHPDLAGKVIAYQNFTREFSQEPDTDIVGHGTHVASTIAGSGVASGGKYRGIAPDAQLVGAKVCFADGEGGCPTSSIIAGMEWAVMEQGAKVVNMSLGGQDTPEIDPTEEAVNRLTLEYGALFVISAGNAGPKDFTVSSPASADAALAVAAVDRSDRVASFSSRGPRLTDRGVKPEIAAPGVGIVAARAAGSGIGIPVGEWYTALSGTSMATPHVVGAAALLSQLHPEWGPEQLKTAIMNSARFDSSSRVLDSGAGSLDVAAASTATIAAEPASLSLGVVRWPHNDDQPFARTVTYRNSGDTDVTLTLSVAASGQDGSAAASGLFSVSPANLAVPAGGSAAATFTADTRAGTSVGVFSGRVIATAADGRRVVTPFALDREEESYDIVLRHLGSDGLPTFAYNTRLVPLDRSLPDTFIARFIPQDVTLRVPAGRYGVNTTITDMSSPAPPGGGLPGLPGPQSTAFIVKPIHLANSDTTVILDARAATPIDARAPTATAGRRFIEIGWDYPVFGSGRYRQSYGVIGPDGTISVATLGEGSEDFYSWVSTQWTDPARTGPTGDAALFAATWVDHRRLPTGRKAVHHKDWAVVKAAYASASASQTLGLAAASAVVGEERFQNQIYLPVTLPGKRTEYYYSSEPAARWVNRLLIPLPSGQSAEFVDARSHRHQLGRQYAARWNEPVFGPLGRGERTGDTMIIEFPLHSDAFGHLGFVAPAVDVTVYRDGEELGSARPPHGIVFLTRPEPATYRVVATGRQEAFGLSTRVDAAWTFDSAHTNVDTSLPLMGVKYKPQLDEQGRAYRRPSLWLPVIVANVGSGTPVHVSSLAVDVSFNDGASWSRVPVSRLNGQWCALIVHPTGADYVSLRATASDPAGNTVEQTTIRAYGLEDRPRAPGH